MRNIHCKHAGKSEKQGTIICAIGKFGSRPHVGTCMACLHGEPEPLSPEGPCMQRGGAMKTTFCCGGKTRAVTYDCGSQNTPEEISAQMCNSRMCRFYIYN